MDKHSDWDITLRDRVRDIEISPSKSLWDDIEQSLDGEAVATPQSQPNYILRWLSGAAAAAAVVVAIFMIDTTPEFNEGSTPLQEEVSMLSELTEQNQPSEITPAVEPLYIAQSVQSSESSEVVDVDLEYQQATQAEQIELKEQSNKPEEQTEASEESADNVVLSESTNSNTSEPTTRREYSSQEFNTSEKQRAKMSISLLGSGALATNQSNKSFAYPTAYDAILDIDDVEDICSGDIYESCGASHRQPFSVGLRVQQDITPRFRWVSGLNYTNLISTITFGSNLSEQQQLHFIGVPLRFDYQLISKRAFSLYAGAGGAIEYCVRASLNGEKMDEKRLHYSTGVALGAEYRVNRWLGLYFEPEVNYFMTETKLKSIRNDNPINLTLRLGVSFTI